ncbi:hypothetical protein Tco_1462474 [Tanacetum coccineum]
MAAAREGFLTDEQREVLKTASENTEMLLSSSPKTTPSWLSDQHIKAPAGERAGNAGIAVRHVRRTHSGKCIRVKKGILHSRRIARLLEMGTDAIQNTLLYIVGSGSVGDTEFIVGFAICTLLVILLPEMYSKTG